MKKHILFSLAIGSLFVLTGCENTNVWEEEQYIKQAYLVGIGEEGALVTRNVNYADESAETFVSVGTSGSLNPISGTSCGQLQHIFNECSDPCRRILCPHTCCHPPGRITL